MSHWKRKYIQSNSALWDVMSDQLSIGFFKHFPTLIVFKVLITEGFMCWEIRERSLYPFTSKQVYTFILMYSAEWFITNRVKLYVHIFFRVSIILILNVTSSRNLHCGRNNHNLQGKKIVENGAEWFIFRRLYRDLMNDFWMMILVALSRTTHGPRFTCIDRR